MREILEHNATPEARAQGQAGQEAETIATWTDAARDRGAVLFVGAGWTRNADPSARPYDGQVHDEPLPLLWSQLVEEFRGELVHDIGKDGNTDPLWLAELHRQRFGEDSLMRLLRRAVPNERLRPGALHHALRSVRWRAILTGNYDTLLEKTFEPFQRVRVCVDDVDLVRSAERDTIELIHLHGVIDRPETIVLALEDYRRYSEKHPGILAKVRQLFLQHPVLFVGFGVTDPNFMQWSGWLSDVVGKGKNPWLNFTPDPPPSLSHGRYWGTRLDFVSVQPFRRFRDVVPKLLTVIGEALDEDTRSEDVATLRIRDAASPSEVIREVRALLDTGERGGAEGGEWDRFRLALFDIAASRILDLAREPWREPSSDEKEQAARGPFIQIDARPLSMREQDPRILTVLRSSFGSEWSAWCRLLSPLFPEPFWAFHRIDLAGQRQSDIWNQTIVRLDDGEGGGSPIGSVSTSSGDPALEALRAGDAVSAPLSPQTAEELRLAGFLDAQSGRWRRASIHYRRAAQASRAEFEPLRTEWLTLRSLAIALEASDLHEECDDEDAIREEKRAVQDQLHTIRTLLAQLPPDGRLDALFGDETDAERKLAAQLVDDLGRGDVDRTTRLGDTYGSAARWLHRVERLFLAPPLLGAAADALGTLQWRYGAMQEAVLTLARYGSKRLQLLVRALVQDADLKPALVTSLIPELLRPGRWPGEWLARSEALVHVLSSCTVEQLVEVGAFVEQARETLVSSPEMIVRGGPREAAWLSRAKIERLETSRWRLLPADDSLSAIERWAKTIAADLASRAMMETRALDVLDDLPWKAWAHAGSIDTEHVERIVVDLIDGRIARYGDEIGVDEIEALLEIVLTLLRARILTAVPGSSIVTRVDALLLRVPERSRGTYAASLADIAGDRKALQDLVEGALASLDLTNRETIRPALETIATAGVCPTTGITKLVAVLKDVTERISNDLRANENRSYLDDAVEQRAGTVGFVVGRLLANASTTETAPLVERAAAIVEVASRSAEHLTTVGVDVLGPTKKKIDAAINELLRGEDPHKLFSRRFQQYAGLRGVVRAVVQRDAATISPEWLTQVCLLTGSAREDVARYACWILGEWASRRTASDAVDLIETTVGPTLRAAACDRRVAIRANGIRGLVALERTNPSVENGEMVARHTADPRVAIRLALSGVGFF